MSRFEVSIHGLLRALTDVVPQTGWFLSFNPRALTSPDLGSYREWSLLLVSIHGLLRALTSAFSFAPRAICFNPRALTSPDTERDAVIRFMAVSIHGLLRALTKMAKCLGLKIRFQSTGSYEPWHFSIENNTFWVRFNPRALTSPDDHDLSKPLIMIVSIHGLLRALTYVNTLFAELQRFQSTGSYEPWQQFQTNYLLKIAAYFISFTIQTTIVNNMLISILNHAQSVRWTFVHVV